MDMPRSSRFEPIKLGTFVERVSSELKREHLLDIAAERFKACGFAAVSVDELVKAAGQSKSNVYSWFGGKKGLFLAAVDRLLDALLVPLVNNGFDQLPLKTGLHELAETVLTIVLGEEALALHRLILAESAAFPSIGRAWIVAGPEKTYRFCADFIAAHQKAGSLRLTDPRRAAIFLHDMLTGDLEHRMLIGERTMPKRTERDRIIVAAIDVFTRAYTV
jgi:AcrR family transcriptional regulator